MKVVVFDFDGTLVQSNQIKESAYYQLFSAIDRELIHSVLLKSNSLSRYEIINDILKKSGRNSTEEMVSVLAEEYGRYVSFAVKHCPSTKGAVFLLTSLMPCYSLYLSSLTPVDSLLEIIDYRHWTPYFKGIFGYPSVKEDTLKEIIANEKCMPSNVLVIGDGESDEKSAKLVGCHFFRVSQQTGLKKCIEYLELDKSV